MRTQNQIKRRISEPEVLDHVREFLRRESRLNRTQVAGSLCRKLRLRDPRGKLQISGCLKALRELERDGLLKLPECRRQTGMHKSPRRLGCPVPAPVNVPADVTDVGELRLIRVENSDQMRMWNEMMIGEHPLGHGPLVGRQLRYLVGSTHGWLGAVGFGAPALKLADRDGWIGWDRETKGRYLDRVICMSRFLIRPSVRCTNLASAVLGMCARELPGDFERKHGYGLWLMESFVDGRHGPGTCYRAANWKYIGRTRGRGRQDRYSQAKQTVKDIYVYPLVADFRRRMGLPDDAGDVPLSPESGLAGKSWAQAEFGNAPLGDRRLTARLVDIAGKKAATPSASWSEAIRGNRAATKAYYRLIDKPDDALLSMESILHTHRQRTERRIRGQRTVLCVQDTTDLNFTSLKQCRGLGVIGKNNTGIPTRGLRLHSTFALSGDGIPLGILRGHCYAPTLKPSRKRSQYPFIPIEQKETFKWIEGLRDCQSLAARAAGTSLTCVMDREADFFDLFDEWNRNRSVNLLVRVRHDRRTEEGVSLFAGLDQAPVTKRFRIKVPRQSARPGRGKHPARPRRPARTAHVAVQYRQMALSAPERGLKRDSEPVQVTVIRVAELNPPEAVEPVNWRLFTTLPVESPDQAMMCVRWYCLRWRIEDWHRVLKSGCRVEDAAHRTAARLKRAIAIDMIIAWRIMLMVLLGRECPGLPADVLFSDLEMEVLRRYAKKKESTTPKHSEPPSS